MRWRKMCIFTIEDGNQSKKPKQSMQLPTNMKAYISTRTKQQSIRKPSRNGWSKKSIDSTLQPKPFVPFQSQPWNLSKRTTALLSRRESSRASLLGLLRNKLKQSTSWKRSQLWINSKLWRIADIIVHPASMQHPSSANTDRTMSKKSKEN